MAAASHLIIGFLFFVITNVFAGNEDDMLPCLELFNPEGVEKMCCESLDSFQHMNNNFDECLTEDSEEWLCEDFQCILNKTEMLQGDDIDENGAKKFFDKLENEYPKEKTLIQRVKRECLGGKYATYPPEDGCPAIKFYICSYINVYLECNSWKNIDVCSQMAANAKKCKAALG